MPIDTGKALGAKARFVLRPGESLSEIISGTAPGGALSTTEPTTGGLAYVLPRTATTWPVAVTDLDPYASGSFTLFWYGVLRDNTGQSLLQSLGSYGWYFLTTPHAPGYLSIGLQEYWGGGTAAVQVPIGDNTLHSIALRYDGTAAPTTIKVFLDGVSAGSAPWNKDPGPMGAGQTFGVWNYSGGAPHKMITAQAFAGLLSDTEISTLAANPFTIFTVASITLTGANATQANAGSMGAVTTDQSKSLVASNCVEGNLSPGTQITQTHILGGSPSVQANQCTGPLYPYARLREIIDAQPVHTWVRVDTTRFLATQVPVSDRQPGIGTGAQFSIIAAWSSFAWDHANANLLLWGGGHANYSGNELYIWNGSTGAWGLASLPSALDSEYFVIDKGGPQSSHTYSNNVWLKNNKMFCSFGGAATPGGTTFQERLTSNPTTKRAVGPWVFDLALADPNKVGGSTGSGWDTVTVKAGSNAWSHRRDKFDGTYPIDRLGPAMQAAVHVDEGGKDVCYLTMDNGGGFPTWYRYEFGADIRAGDRDTVTQIGQTWNSVIFDGWGDFDPVRRHFYRNAVNSGTYTSEMVAMHVDSGSPATQDTSIQLVDDQGAPFSVVQSGGAYDRINDRIYFWNGDMAHPGRVYYVTPPAWNAATGWASTTWTVKQVDPAGTVPGGNSHSGVLGKFKYVPELGGMVGLDDVASGDINSAGVWLFKTADLANNQAGPGPGSLAGASSLQANISPAAGIAQDQVLAASGSLQANSGSAGAMTLGTAINLAMAPGTQNNKSGAGSIRTLGPSLPTPASRTLNVSENRTLGVKS